MFGKLGLGLGLGAQVGGLLPETKAYIARVETTGGVVMSKTKANADITLLKTSGIYDAIIAAGQGFCWTASAGVKIDTTIGIDTISRIYNMVPITETPANYDYAQGTKEAQPPWANNLIVFTGDTHYLLSESAGLGIANGITNLTAFAVFKHVSTPAATGYIFAAINASGQSIRTGFGRSKSKHMVAVSNNDGLPEVYASAGDMISATAIVQTVKIVFGDGSGSYNIRENGTEVFANASLLNIIPATNPHSIKIGNLLPPTASRSPKINMSALIVLPFAVSDAVRNAIEAHLLSVYGG